MTVQQSMCYMDRLKQSATSISNMERFCAFVPQHVIMMCCQRHCILLQRISYRTSPKISSGDSESALFFPFLQSTGKSKCETEAETKKGKIDIVELAGKLLSKAKEQGVLFSAHKGEFL